jgi:hypothetical protein
MATATEGAGLEAQIKGAQVLCGNSGMSTLGATLSVRLYGRPARSLVIDTFGRFALRSYIVLCHAFFKGFNATRNIPHQFGNLAAPKH